jgi:hypothetical protein
VRTPVTPTPDTARGEDDTAVNVGEATIAPSAAAPRQARMFVDEFLEDVGADHLEDLADLLTSEIVSDAMRHRPSQLRLRVTFDHEMLRVEVSDDPGIVEDPLGGYLERTVGRRLARELANNWGSEFDRSRTTTWFELAADAEDARVCRALPFG